MVRTGLKYLALALLLVGLALLTGGAWLVGTTNGTRTLLRAVSLWTPLKIDAGSVSGRLADELLLENVRVNWPRGEAATGVLRLNWNPRQLFQGNLAIEELEVADLEIRLGKGGGSVSGGKGARPLWPLVSGAPLGLEGTLESLQLSRVTIHGLGGKPLVLEEATLHLELRDGVLALSRLEAQTPYGRVSGEVSAGLTKPSLRADLLGEPADNPGGIESVRLKVDLGAGGGEELLAGPLQVDMRLAGDETWHLLGELGLGEAGGELRELLLTRSAAAGEVRGRLQARFDGENQPLAAQLRLLSVDLAPETGVSTALSGVLDIAGTPGRYEGEFDLANSGESWRDLQLAGRLSGGLEGISLSDLDGLLLAGRVGGELSLDWSGPFLVAGTLQGENLDPGLLSPPLTGRVNFNLTSTLLFPPDLPPQLEIVGSLEESILRGHPLFGVFNARLVGGDLLLRHLELHGEGVDLTAAGRLKERIDFALVLPRLADLLPGAVGGGRGEGWLRWREGELSGVFQGQGTALAYAGLAVDRGALQLERPLPGGPIALHADLGGIRYRNLLFDRLELQGDGLLQDHRVRLDLKWPQGQAEIVAEGGYSEGRWTGELVRLEGKDEEQGGWRLASPVTLAAGGDVVRFTPLELVSDRGERLEVAGDYDLASGRGEGEAQWEDLTLDRANPWLPELHLFGKSSGALEGAWRKDGTLVLKGKLVAAGRLEHQSKVLEARHLEAEFSWDDKGLLALWDLDLSGGGNLFGRLDSAEKGRLALPQSLALQVDWTGLDLALFKDWAPPGLTVDGLLSGGLTAELFPGGTFDVSGEAAVDGGLLTWEEQGTVTVALRSGEFNWRWRKKALVLDLALVLAEDGQLAGSFSIPLPAVWPLRIPPAGALWGEVEGTFRERGLLGTLLPGLLRESHGDLTLDLALGGTWQSPEFSGGLSLTGAGAYLPRAGIELRDLRLQAEFAGDRLRILSLEVFSGEGSLKGEGELRLERWEIAEFHGTLGGERFLVVNLPELQLAVSPELTVEGTAKRVKVRGEIHVPELLVRGRQTQAPLHQHPDVVLVNGPGQSRRTAPVEIDLEVRVVLGDRVLVQFGGIDARLEGDVLIDARSLDAVSGRGKIHVAKGTYSAYGMKLNISRGTLLFAGGPVDQPTLDILALRTVGEVKAGVRVSGTPRSPLVTLYSDPVMPDTDVLSYIVLGRPMGSDAGQASLLLVAAGALLSKGESTVLQDRLRRRVGLDVLDIQAGNGDVTESVVTLGKYLNPKLYISFGHSLFTNSNVVGLRYSISEHWQAESSVGEESGVDLFYKIEFR
ncbi:autotransporter secretion inner membrane protein TamB [Desulfuromonas soudanensis]|uniref:Autotransporter secretion inner membrane protein TamB n=1 Tax=Desulfuromonas soudanensis TaxID=1603606 RepID=A0A0M5IVL6_9BACT|nr:translocation/assembly module TamB domain-containing protein [Desulfuromonas soudanensis]ALC15974.1 autotransporter secretion inner membrane protein TamB [Desulfuromonas soudanensis]